MKRLNSVYLAILLVVFGCAPASGQENNDKLEETIISFVNGIRKANPAAVRSTIAPNYRSNWKVLPKFPILERLGAAESAFDLKRSFLFGEPVAVATLTHERGSSNWQFKITTNSELIDAQFLDATVYKKRATPFPTVTGWSTKKARRHSRPATVVADSCDKSPSSCSASGAKTYDPRLVEFFYATDRKLSISKNVATIDTGSGRTGDLSYGMAAVHIPKDHEPGRIELPSEWRFLGIEFKSRTDDDKHFSIKRLASVSLDDWKTMMKNQIGDPEGKTALVFVHGFNTSFEEALFRNAQIVWDLGYSGTSVLYAWSSKGGVRDYIYDRDSADIAQPGFIALLGTLKELGIERVNVLAHSMGNRVVLPALSSIASTGKPAIKLDNLIMAAPDVARDLFINQFPAVQQIARGATLYASAADKALLASSALANFPRAGLVPAEGPVVLPHLDTIDVTAVGEDVLGLNHTVFAKNRAVMDDLKLLIIDGLKLPRLAQVRRAPEPPALPSYWKYR